MGEEWEEGSTKIIVQTVPVSGSANVSIPVKCIIMKPGQRRSIFISPTRPKNNCMFTRDSSPTCFFNTIVYTPYMTALNPAMASPSAISVELLLGNLPPLPSSAGGASDADRSTRDIKIIPTKEATTPASLRTVNFSTPMRAPKIRVQTPIIIDVKTSAQC